MSCYVVGISLYIFCLMPAMDYTSTYQRVGRLDLYVGMAIYMQQHRGQFLDTRRARNPVEARSRELGVRRVLYRTSYSASIELLAPPKAKKRGCPPPPPPPPVDTPLMHDRICEPHPFQLHVITCQSSTTQGYQVRIYGKHLLAICICMIMHVNDHASSYDYT